VEVAAAQQSRKDYTEALSALASGETTAAKQLLEKAVAEDPGNTVAKKKLDEMRAAPLPKGKEQPRASKPAPKTPAPTKPAGGSPGGSTNPTGATQPDTSSYDPAFDNPVSDIKALLPKSVPGFALGQVAAADADAELPLDPDYTLGGLVAAAQVSVHDRGSLAAAATYVTQHSGTLYKNGAKAVDVNGTQARTGTDSGRLAAVIFSRGRFAFEVVVTSSGSDPSQVLDVALDVAKAFPTKP
jgi:hypothetical protein